MSLLLSCNSLVPLSSLVSLGLLHPHLKSPLSYWTPLTHGNLSAQVELPHPCKDVTHYKYPVVAVVRTLALYLFTSCKPIPLFLYLAWMTRPHQTSAPLTTLYLQEPWLAHVMLILSLQGHNILYHVLYYCIVFVNTLTVWDSNNHTVPTEWSLCLVRGLQVFHLHFPHRLTTSPSIHTLCQVFWGWFLECWIWGNSRPAHYWRNLEATCQHTATLPKSAQHLWACHTNSLDVLFTIMVTADALRVQHS